MSKTITKSTNTQSSTSVSFSQLPNCNKKSTSHILDLQLKPRIHTAAQVVGYNTITMYPITCLYPVILESPTKNVYNYNNNIFISPW